jgi:hypothetical protein
MHFRSYPECHTLREPVADRHPSTTITKNRTHSAHVGAHTPRGALVALRELTGSADQLGQPTLPRPTHHMGAPSWSSVG